MLQVGKISRVRNPSYRLEKNEFNIILDIWYTIYNIIWYVNIDKWMVIDSKFLHGASWRSVQRQGFKEEWCLSLKWWQKETVEDQEKTLRNHWARRNNEKHIEKWRKSTHFCWCTMMYIMWTIAQRLQSLGLLGTNQFTHLKNKLLVDTATDYSNNPKDWKILRRSIET